MELYLKVGGAALVAASGVLAGLYAAREFARRVREIEAMIDCLNRMQAEIALRLTPMDEIFKPWLRRTGRAPYFLINWPPRSPGKPTRRSRACGSARRRA